MTEHVAEPPSGGKIGAESTRNVPVMTPAADIYETDDGLVILVEMPGVEPDAIDVTVEKRELMIMGRTRATPPAGHSLAHAEYRDGDYQRAFTLSDAIDSDHIEASMKDGVLRLALPKAKPAPARTISVQAG